MISLNICYQIFKEITLKYLLPDIYTFIHIDNFFVVFISAGLFFIVRLLHQIIQPIVSGLINAAAAQKQKAANERSRVVKPSC